MAQSTGFGHSATREAFTATAEGDIASIGVTSMFAFMGTVVSGTVTVRPRVVETHSDP